MLSVHNLSKSFGRKKALDNVSLTFDHGIYGLLGPNGAGKTTLLRCMTMLYPISRDTVQYNGRCIRNNKNYFQKVGYLPQKFGLLKELTVFEALSLLWDLKELPQQNMNEKISDVIELVNLSDRKDSKVKTLSGGMVRRLGVAQALLGETEILFFDEPTAGLDPEERLRFQNVISSLGKEKTILLSTHIVTDVESLCDQVIIMNEGHVLMQGSCSEVAALANGKTFLVPEKSLGEIVGKYHIQRTMQNDGEKFMKILTSNPQQFPSAVSEVEDGYICCVKQI